MLPCSAQVSTPFAGEVVESADAYLFAGAVFNDYSTVGYSLNLQDAKMIKVDPYRVTIAGGKNGQVSPGPCGSGVWGSGLGAGADGGGTLFPGSSRSAAGLHRPAGGADSGSCVRRREQPELLTPPTPPTMSLFFFSVPPEPRHGGCACVRVALRMRASSSAILRARSSG